MTTSRRLGLLSGGASVEETLAENYDKFKRQHSSQNREIIHKNSELMKTNAFLNRRVNELQSDYMTLKAENLRQSARIVELENKSTKLEKMLDRHKRNAQSFGPGFCHENVNLVQSALNDAFRNIQTAQRIFATTSTNLNQDFEDDEENYGYGYADEYDEQDHHDQNTSQEQEQEQSEDEPNDQSDLASRKPGPRYTLSAPSGLSLIPETEGDADVDTEDESFDASKHRYVLAPPSPRDNVHVSQDINNNSPQGSVPSSESSPPENHKNINVDINARRTARRVSGLLVAQQGQAQEQDQENTHELAPQAAEEEPVFHDTEMSIVNQPTTSPPQPQPPTNTRQKQKQKQKPCSPPPADKLPSEKANKPDTPIKRGRKRKAAPATKTNDNTRRKSAPKSASTSTNTDTTATTTTTEATHGSIHNESAQNGDEFSGDEIFIVKRKNTTKNSKSSTEQPMKDITQRKNNSEDQTTVEKTKIGKSEDKMEIDSSTNLDGGDQVQNINDDTSASSSSRRARKPVNYALPSLNSKMRQPDGYVPVRNNNRKITPTNGPSRSRSTSTSSKPEAEEDELSIIGNTTDQ